MDRGLDGLRGARAACGVAEAVVGVVVAAVWAVPRWVS